MERTVPSPWRRSVLAVALFILLGTLAGAAAVEREGLAGEVFTSDALIATSDLAITAHTAAPVPEVLAGGTITYTIGFANNGPEAAGSASIKDTVPWDTTYVSSRVVAGAGWQVVSAPAVGTRGDIIWSKSGPGPSAGETAVFEVVVTVDAATLHGSTIYNTATTYSIDPETADPDVTNNTLTRTTRAVQVVDPLEPNDTAATATVLPMGANDDLIYGGMEDDWYKFFVPPEAAGQDLKVNLRITSVYPDPAPSWWRSDIDFELFDGALTILGVAQSGSDNETLYIPNAASGWYYVHTAYCTIDYADSAGYARYSITVEAGAGFGIGYISGRLVDQDGQGIQGVYMEVMGDPHDHDVSFPIVTSGPGGHFVAAATPGPHQLRFTGKIADACPIVNIVQQSYPESVSVTEEQTVDLGEITVAIGAIVSGRVTNASDAPLATALVYAFDAAGAGRASAYTDVNGEYTLPGVPAGARLRFSRGSYATEFYDDRPSLGAATICPTQAGAALTGINAQLSMGGGVSGTVRNGLGAGLGVNVRLLSVTDGVNQYASRVSSSDTGAFSFTNIKAGEYKVFFSPAAAYWGYAPEWYGDAASFDSASVITVTEGVTTTGVDAVLRRLADRDGDGKTDISVYRPASGTWFSLDSTTANTTYRYRGWGVEAEGDRPVVGDFDGDGILDPAVFRPAAGTWFILESSSNYADWRWFGWGNATDTLVPGDYDGDGRTDAAVYRGGTWYVSPSGGGAAWSVVFGEAGDQVVAGDFDGDGKRDPAVYRPSSGTWFWLKSSMDLTELDYRGWGVQAEGDVPAPGDYDGDGKTDLCVFRPASGTWFMAFSHKNFTTWSWLGWGSATDVLAQSDYDGDGKTDPAVYRPSTFEWFVRPSSSATPWNVTFGAAGDVPLTGGR